MEKENKILGILVIILSIFVLTLTGFIIYDKVVKENNVVYDNWMDYIMNSNINSIELSYCIENTFDNQGLPVRETINITNSDLNKIFNEMKKGTISKTYYGALGGPCVSLINIKYISNENEYQLDISDGYSIDSITDPKILSYLENTEYTIKNYGTETDLTNAPYTYEYNYNKTIIDEIVDNYKK